MSEPPSGLDAVSDAALDAFIDEILNAPDSVILLPGIHRHALPALRDALQHHLDTTNVLVDRPSRHICRFALLEVDEMIGFGRRAFAAIVDDSALAAFAPQEVTFERLLAQAGELGGTAEPAGGEIARHNPPRPYDSAPQRDERFPDPYNMESTRKSSSTIRRCWTLPRR